MSNRRYIARAKAKSKQQVRAIQLLTEQQEALRLRREGMTYAKIAETMGFSEGKAYLLVQQALTELHHDRDDQAKQLLAEMLEWNQAVIAEHLPRILAGEFELVPGFVRLQDQLMKILALAPPVAQDQGPKIYLPDVDPPPVFEPDPEASEDG